MKTIALLMMAAAVAPAQQITTTATVERCESDGLAGRVTLSDQTIAWQSGDKFDPRVAGRTILIAASGGGFIAPTIAEYISPTEVRTLSGLGADATARPYSITFAGKPGGTPCAGFAPGENKYRLRIASSNAATVAYTWTAAAVLATTGRVATIAGLVARSRDGEFTAVVLDFGAEAHDIEIATEDLVVASVGIHRHRGR